MACRSVAAVRVPRRSRIRADNPPGCWTGGWAQVALKNKVNLKDCLKYVKDARERGLTVPIILMGYLNPFLAYGLEDLMKDAQEAGACSDGSKSRVFGGHVEIRGPAEWCWWSLRRGSSCDDRITSVSELRPWQGWVGEDVTISRL